MVKISHTGITVSNLERSIEFYRDLLGLQVTRSERLEGVFFERLTGVAGAQIEIAFVKTPGHVLELVQYVKPERTRTVRLQPNDPGFMHICMKVKEIERIVIAVGEYGFKGESVVLESTEDPGKGVKAIYVRDPDGVSLELIEEPPTVVLEDLLDQGEQT